MELKRGFFLNIQGQGQPMMLKASLPFYMGCLDQFLMKRIFMMPFQKLSANTPRSAILTYPFITTQDPMTDTMTVAYNLSTYPLAVGKNVWIVYVFRGELILEFLSQIEQ